MLETMKKEYQALCIQHDEVMASRILDYFDTSIPWLSEDVYSTKALSFISHRFLSNLPHYESHPEELEGGVLVPGEADTTLRVVSPLNICVCSDNEGHWVLLKRQRSY